MNTSTTPLIHKYRHMVRTRSQCYEKTRLKFRLIHESKSLTILTQNKDFLNNSGFNAIISKLHKIILKPITLLITAYSTDWVNLPWNPFHCMNQKHNRDSKIVENTPWKKVFFIYICGMS